MANFQFESVSICSENVTFSTWNPETHGNPRTGVLTFKPIQKVCQGGGVSNFDNFFFLPIFFSFLMAFPGRADNVPTLNAGLIDL